MRSLRDHDNTAYEFGTPPPPNSVKKRAQSMSTLNIHLNRQVLDVTEKVAQTRVIKIAQTYRSLSNANLQLWNNLSSRAFRGSVILGCGLAFFQHFSGINTIMNYSTTIIEQVGLASKPADAVYWSLPIVLLQVYIVTHCRHVQCTAAVFFAVGYCNIFECARY